MEENETVFLILTILSRTIKFIMDLFIFFELYRVVWIFVKIKLSLMKKNGKSVSAVSLVSILSIYLIISINFFHTLMWQLTYFLPKIIDRDEYSKGWFNKQLAFVYLYYVYPFKDILTLSGMAALYLYQSMQEERQKSGILPSKIEIPEEIVIISPESEINQVLDSQGKAELI